MLTIPTIETFVLEETRTKKITLTAYIKGATPDVPPSLCRRAVLICPGGGYRYVSDREAEVVALRFLAMGFDRAFPPGTSPETTIAALREIFGMEGEAE